ncbi:Histone demethylase UTY [Plecturocebus cupreus]
MKKRRHKDSRLRSSWDSRHAPSCPANFVFLVETEFLHVGQADFELPTSATPISWMAGRCLAQCPTVNARVRGYVNLGLTESTEEQNACLLHELLAQQLASGRQGVVVKARWARLCQVFTLLLLILFLRMRAVFPIPSSLPGECVLQDSAQMSPPPKASTGSVPNPPSLAAFWCPPFPPDWELLSGESELVLNLKFKLQINE